MKRVLIYVLAISLCFASAACNVINSGSPATQLEKGVILSLPELTKIGIYNVEGVSLIPSEKENSCKINICLRAGSSFDYKDTAVSVKINGAKTRLEQSVNNSSWAMYSASGIEYASDIIIRIKDASITEESTVSLNKTRYELYKASLAGPVYGICARAYTLSENGSLIFLDFTNSSENKFVDYFINNYDLMSVGANMFYISEDGSETAVSEIGGMIGEHPFTGIKGSYLNLRPAKASDVKKLRIKSIYVSKFGLSEAKLKEFDDILSIENSEIEITDDADSYTVIFKEPLDIPVIS